MEVVKYIALFLCILPVALSEVPVVVVTTAKEDSPVSVSCGDLDSTNENETLRWIYVDANGMNKTLDMEDVSINITDNTATGKYICEVNGIEIVSYTAAKLTAAVILNTRKSVTYNDGDTNRKITCAVEGSYPAPTFIWKKKGEIENEAAILLSETDPNFIMNSTGDRSVLMFHNVSYDDQAYYICDVKNEAGNTTIEVMIRVKDKYAALWPFIGIVIEVVVLIAIIFLYEKHSKKSSTLDDLPPQPEDEKPLQSEEGTEVRNRNGKK